MMIMIDIWIPALNKGLDLELDDRFCPGEIVSNLKKMMTGYAFSERTKDVFSYRECKFLTSNISLKDQGIRTGDRLFYI